MCWHSILSASRLFYPRNDLSYAGNPHDVCDTVRRVRSQSVLERAMIVF